MNGAAGVRAVPLLLAMLFSPAWAGEDYLKLFPPDAYYAVRQDGERYLVLASSPFKDADARRSMELLSKSLLFHYLQKQDKAVTGLDLKQLTPLATGERNGRLFAVYTVEIKNVVRKYGPSTAQQQSVLSAEIAALEAIAQKSIETHEQLRELYFMTGDLENFDKQSDIVMEMKFNEH